MRSGRTDSDIFKVCLRAGHNYIAIEDSDFRTVIGSDTHISRSFICTKCGAVIAREIAVWKNFIPKKQE